MFERKQVVARRDARAAVTHDLLDRNVAEDSQVRRTKFIRRSKHAGRSCVVLKKAIEGSGNVTGHAIERLDVAAVAFRRTSVEEQCAAMFDDSGNLVEADGHVGAQRCCKPSGRACVVTGAGRFDGTSFSRPLREAAVEDSDRVMAQPAKHPPEPARKHARVLIVGNDLHPRSDAQSY